jgi:hypothetical protein
MWYGAVSTLRITQWAKLIVHLMTCEQQWKKLSVTIKLGMQVVARMINS